MSLSVDIRHALPGLALDVRFEAPAGITVLFGRSGAGKTTVVNAVAGLLRPDQGRISVNGRVLFDSGAGVNLPPHRRRLGYVFQEARLFPHMTVRRNLAYGQRFAPKGAGGEEMGRVVEMLGIGALLDRRPGALSGGERQRVAIGRALLAAPKLILADEPLASLDEARKAEILPYFERLRDEVAVPILYVSHAAAEVARLATSVVVLEDGRAARQGAAAEVLSDPAVTPLGVRSAGAMLEARVVRHHADGLSELQADGLTLWLPRVPQAEGTPLRVRVEAHDVMLALTRPEGISALNVLPATVREIRMGDGPGALVQLSAGPNRLLARVTRRSVEALELRPGLELFAVLKAVGVAKESVADL
ncbi:molybdenum ABC transporter ATP-binding protein [Psychromarinibacter sp. C21-152]|uniref:Molybdenum ABC transporter ATP-binding protein n=1 Tax=Psychromarinibacter sediminicola TaxID=3033385 RepID=A0AAE3NN48_9RHOB|nr:molybdenum ABC transporter ATP-binding protein [Psychromarinibacter sediminicola]MDF0599359.1 molybdenum ABC transporter ATP-binding protein [Psychromarinibacter sediminicola]